MTEHFPTVVLLIAYAMMLGAITWLLISGQKAEPLGRLGLGTALGTNRLMSDVVTLQFTQADRDMIRDTNGDVKQILDNLDSHKDTVTELAARISKLETWQSRAVAICCFAGFLADLVAKVVWK